jgi:hypothetical protein
MTVFEKMASRSALAALILLFASGGREACADFIVYDSYDEMVEFYLPVFDPNDLTATIVEGGQQVTLLSGPARLTGVDIYGFNLYGAGTADFTLNLYRPDAPPSAATLIFSETIYDQYIPALDDPFDFGEYFLVFEDFGDGVDVPGSLIWTITYANLAPDPSNIDGLVGIGGAVSGPPGVGTQGSIYASFDGTNFVALPPFDVSADGGPSQAGLTATFYATAVPEPPSAALGLAALAALGIARAVRAFRRPRAA